MRKSSQVPRGVVRARTERNIARRRLAKAERRAGNDRAARAAHRVRMGKPRRGFRGRP